MATAKVRKTRAARRGTSVNQKGSVRKAKTPPSLLVLECNSALLASQEITLAGDVFDIARRFVPKAIMSLVQGTRKEELLFRLGECKQQGGEFGLVVVIGHSAQRGIRLTPDHEASWSEFALWLSPFRPQRVILVACEAGRWLPSVALFSGIPTLQEIYGSPVVTTQQQAAYVKLLVPYFLSGKRLPKDILLIQATNFLLTRGVVFRQTRAEFRRCGPTDGAIWTGLEELLRTIVAAI